MTRKTTQSNDNHANRAQIERAGRLDPVRDKARFRVSPMTSSGWHRAEDLARRTPIHFQMAESSEDKDGGHYRIRTYDFYRVKT